MKKLATSGTLEGIKKLIAEFYGGESKELVEVSPGLFHIYSGTKGPLSTQVRQERKRFIFETR